MHCHFFSADFYSLRERRLLFETPLQEIHPDKVIESVVGQAKDKKILNLTPNELTVLARNAAMLKESAAVKQMAKTEREHLIAQLKERREQYTGEAIEALDIEKLEELEKNLQGLPTKDAKTTPQGQPAEVSDIASEKSKEKGVTGKAKEFFSQFAGAIGGTSVIGMFVRGWVSFRRQWLEWFPPKDAEKEQKKLNSIEQLYGKFFGATELRENIAKIASTAKLKIVDGTKDAIAYARLKVKHQESLRVQLAAAKSEEERQAIFEAHPFEAFVADQTEKYLRTYQAVISEGKGRVTTLFGIVNDEKPREESAEDAAKNASAKKETGGFFDIFSFFKKS